MRLMSMVVASVVSVSSTFSFGVTREEVAARARHLQRTTQELIDIARYRCGCVNTANGLDKIHNLAIDVEVEGLYGTAYSASEIVKDMAREVIKLRQFVRHIHHSDIKSKIRRDLALSFNALGKSLFGTVWVPVVAAQVSQDGTVVTQDLEPSIDDSTVEGYLDLEMSEEF